MGNGVYVTLPGGLSQQELDDIESELRDAGLDVLSIEAATERIFGIDDAIFAGLIVAALHGFFEGFGDEAGKDAYKGLKKLVRRVAAKTHRGDDGVVILQDQQSGVRADLTPRLDDEAYSALFELDFESFTGTSGTLVWDSGAREWRQID